MISIEMKNRVKTAAIGVAVILFLVLGLGHFGAWILAIGLSVATLKEFLDFSLQLNDKEEKKKLLLGSVCILQCVHFWARGIEFGLAFFFFILISLYFLFTSSRHQSEKDLSTHFEECLRANFGFFYLGLTWTFLISLRQMGNGVHWTMLFLLLVWSNDIGAYFAGRRWGKRKLFPLISPKKTWEGLWGGMAAGLGVALLYKAIFFPGLGWVSTVLLATIIGPVSAMGDLMESFLKRAFHAKDSGHLLPGHGGFLDRFDGVLFSLPIMYGLTRVLG
jgi:phosphatidate cytidylyltransferase